MLDQDLAELYGVETKALTRAVRRNEDRFPVDFMFRLSAEEFADLRSQFGTSNPDRVVGAIRRTCSPSRAWQCSQASYAASEPLP